MTSKLPHYAAAFHNVTGCPIILERGREGFYLLTSGEHPDSFNKRLGVTPAQREAMICGSMFGFHVPGADPDQWTDAHDQSRDAPADGNLMRVLKKVVEAAKGEELFATEQVKTLMQQRDELEAEVIDLENRRTALRAQEDTDNRLEVIRQRKAEEDAQRASEAQKRAIEQGPDFGCF